MAIALSYHGTHASGTGTNAITITQATNDVVVVGVQFGTTASIGDTAGNTWVTAIGAGGSGFTHAAIFYACGVPSGSNTITVTASGGSSLCWAGFTGCATSAALDITKSAAPSFASSWSTGNPATTAQANEVLFCFAGQSVSKTPPYFTAGSGYTKLDEDASSFAVSEYQIVSATGVYPGTFTLGDATNGGEIGVVSFLGAGAVANTLWAQSLL